jgi:UBX domain-containing protein 1/4
LKLSKKTEESEKTESEASTSVSNEISVNSLKCDDCGLLLKDEDFATLHAHKTGHINFSQSTEAIKPKTKEEIEEQKKRLAEKLVKLRQEKAEKERLDAIESEKARRKQGRQINDFKQKFQEDEMKRIAEEKRRDKIADAAYR